MPDNPENLIRLPANQKNVKKNWIKNCLNSLNFQDQILCSKDGDIYRIATIVNQHFANEKAVNLQPINKNIDDKETGDEIWIGLYVVKPQENQQEDPNEAKNFLRKRDKELKILLLLCKTEKDQHAINNSGFVLCGDYLCWQYPEQASVHVLNMSRLNSIRLKRR